MRASGAATRALAAAVVAIAIAAFATHAAVAVGSGNFDAASGVFLALGHDAHAGHFYRPLISDLGYGGTRYFPLFFLVIAAFLRAGAGILAAGWLASAVAAIVLVSGMYRLVRALDGERWMAILFAVSSLAPYFVQQTLIEIRADVMAAAFNVWGLAHILPAWRIDSTGAEYARPWRAAIAFTLAMAVKVTSLSIPLVLIVAALAARRRPLAIALAWRLMIGVATFLALVVLLSAGRALDSWRLVMSAGADLRHSWRSLLSGDLFVLAGYSRLLLVLLLVTSCAMAAALSRAIRHAIRPDASRSIVVPALLFLGALLTAGVLLSSPGTVASNHIVEWIEIAMVSLAMIACTHRVFTQALVWVVALFTLWASAQDLRLAKVTWDQRADAAGRAAIGQFIDQVGSAPRPVLSESSVWPLLAGREPYSIDAFALRVVTERRPDIERDLTDKIDRHFFPLVILKVDPTTDAGHGYYTHQNFGWPAIEQLLAQYRLAGHPRDDVFVYVPRRD